MQLQDLLGQVGLTDTQSKDIASIIQAEKSKVASLKKRIDENWNDLMRVSFAAQFNLSMYNTSIDRLSVLNKQVIMAHGQMLRDISAKLTKTGFRLRF